jgi:hypothetical protein
MARPKPYFGTVPPPLFSEHCTMITLTEDIFSGTNNPTTLEEASPSACYKKFRPQEIAFNLYDWMSN